MLSIFTQRIEHGKSGRFPEAAPRVAVVRVLLTAGLDLGGQAAGEVIHQGIKLIEDGDDAGLFYKGFSGRLRRV